MSKRFFCLIFVVPFSIMILGCITPETIPPPPSDPVVIRETLMPFSYSLLQRLSDANLDVTKFQFILFGRISLEREHSDTRSSLGDGGMAMVFTDHIRDIITISDQTKGKLIRDEPVRSGVKILPVCFEADDTKSLNFISRTNEPDSYFYLSYTPNRGSVGEEKGTLKYGGETYKLKFSGEKPPYLLIILSQKDTDMLNARTVHGRNIE